MHVAVVANAGDADDGFVGRRLKDLDSTFVRRDREEPDALTDCEAGIDLLLLLGSDWSVYDQVHVESIRAEQELILRTQERGIPILGICFGGQLLAATLGREVTPTPLPEIGWRVVESDDPTVVKGPWFQYHFDRWSDGGEVRSFARTTSGPQAFWYGRTLGVQFHPEVTPTMIEQWLANGRLAVESVGEDVEKIMSATRSVARDAEQRCYAFVDQFLSSARRRDYRVRTD